MLLSFAAAAAVLVLVIAVAIIVIAAISALTGGARDDEQKSGMCVHYC